MDAAAPRNSSSRLLVGGAIAVLAGLVALVLLWFVFLGETGAHFDRESDFVRAQNKAGWREMGRYTHPLDFPARVTAVETARDGISFATPDGVPHNYPGFTGMEFKLYTFQPDDSAKDAFVVLMMMRR